jgi:hypothetical protein
MLSELQTVLSSPVFLVAWAVLVLPSVAILVRDLRVRNAHLMSLMKTVWVLTVLYSGPLGLAIYWFTGRKEIADDGLGRRAFRSVAHCYAGCGMGEIIGLTLAVGVLALGTAGTAATTFAFAYAMGFALTVGPLVQGGVAWGTAMRDAVITETPSIGVMEAVAIGVDLTLAGDAGLGEALFWSSMVVLLTAGLVAAYPVNVLLIHWGVKEGMMDPRNTDHAHA